MYNQFSVKNSIIVRLLTLSATASASAFAFAFASALSDNFGSFFGIHFLKFLQKLFFLVLLTFVVTFFLLGFLVLVGLNGGSWFSWLSRL